MRGNRERACACSIACSAAGCVRSDSPPHHARRIRARAARQLQPCALHRRRRWLLGSPSTRRPSPRLHGWPTACDSTSGAILATAIRVPRIEEAMRKLAELCQARLEARYEGASAQSQRTAALAAAGGAADHRRAEAPWLLPVASRHARAGAGGGCRGTRTGCSASASTAWAGPGIERLVDRLLPDRPLARRSDRQRADDRALPERGADVSAGHRPRLPPGHPREADPARSRTLRARSLGAGGGVPDLSRARCDPGARQGARAAPGRDRTGGARKRGLGRAQRGQGHRERVRIDLAGDQVASATPVRGCGSRPSRLQRDGGYGLRAWPRRRTGFRAISPSTREG